MKLENRKLIFLLLFSFVSRAFRFQKKIESRCDVNDAITGVTVR